MCRHIAYVGEPVTLGEVLVRPPHSLVRQSWEPRRQRYGTVNADGFGVGWYAEGDPAPGRYRRQGPWPASLAGAAAALPAEKLLSLAARNDSALVWALIRHRTDAGDDVPRAVAETVREVAAAAPGSRLNLLLTDGATITATAWGDTLWYLTEPGRRTAVASEPYDDDPLWREVPDRTLLVATASDVLLTPLKEPPA
ncbi:class II glutamine amidotransferase [Streptomyces globisporus]|uniref:Class II glutamine amidotransferase n=1 Tax=Streptomyces globisporus TaxID=1908 RepID=A0A423UU96_STRGL|nr:class II glutamine amidotransferase [Streptomyces globisporus]ROV65911.1 class II glutamine amidotransferase [Streptomyces globisporus]